MVKKRRVIAGGLLALVAIIAALITLIKFAEWGSDIGNIISSTLTLVHGRPPIMADLSIYPATTYILYTPLGLLPSSLITPITQLGCLVGILAILWIWA